ncbi:Alpha/Beta hydrolase protein [Coprinopsis sp. MPI-PUGE-AT-0042]|nr:Alpha/Beta hydrolase protein [Coprinopsis sp. MPI-PUGE-AT-0042]
MPTVSANPSGGPITFNYKISTPTCPSADSIDPSLPTVLLLHPIYMEHHFWHPQLSSPALRRFNIVTLDGRGHGLTVGAVPSNFRRPEAADDVYHFMKALNLPPCHIVGISMGACIGLETTVSHPDRVLSLSLIAPLPLKEPEEVLAGRQEIYECFSAAVSPPEGIDEEALNYTAQGAYQLGTNGLITRLGEAVVTICMPYALAKWTKDKLDDAYTLSVTFFQDRKPHTIEQLGRISCPVSIVHCGADIAYPVEFADELRQRLDQAGVDVQLVSAPGAPHFGTLTHFDTINPIVHDFIIQCTKGDVPPELTTVVSPFEKEFAAVGCRNLGCDSDDSDSEDEYFA